METKAHYDLGRAFRTGGEEELKQIMDVYSDTLFRYCCHIIGDYHEAEDVLQTAFIRAYKKRSSTLKSSGHRKALWTRTGFGRSLSARKHICLSNGNRKTLS